MLRRKARRVLGGGESVGGTLDDPLDAAQERRVDRKSVV